MYEELAIVFAGVGSLAAAIGLIFNGWANLQQSKSNYYTIFKELEEEYNGIDSRTISLKDYLLTNDSELKNQATKIYADTTQFKRDYVQFHEKLASLFYNKVVPKNIPEFFDQSFAYSLFYIDTSHRNEKIKKQVNNLIKWCKEHNIEKIQPFEKQET